MNLGTLRAALKYAIENVEGLNVDDLRDNVNVPCAIVLPDGPFPLDLTFLEVDDTHFQCPRFRILILVPYIDTANAQEQLDTFLATSGPSSVKAALEADPTLGGIVNDVHVNELRSYSVMQMRDGGTEYLAGELIVEVYTK